MVRVIELNQKFKPEKVILSQKIGNQVKALL
jgi:hypothetical protein